MQSAAAGNGNTTSVAVNGAVTGGTGANGAGVFVSSGAFNVLTIGAGGSITAGDGDALSIRYDGDYDLYTATLTVENSGTVTGDYSFVSDYTGGAAGTFTNETGGTFVPDTASTGDLVNAGTVDLTASGSGSGAATAGRVGAAFELFALTGDFRQTDTGRLLVAADFRAGTATGMAVSGDVRLDGTVAVRTDTLLREAAVPVVVAGGSLAGTLEARDSRAVDFETARQGRTVRVRAVATDFGRAFDGLSANERRVGAHLDALFDARSRRYAALLGALNTLADGGDGAAAVAYGRALSSLTPGASQAMAAAQAGLARGRLDGAMRCRALFGGTPDLSDDGCVWASGSGDVAAQGGTAGYDATNWGMGTGVQVAIGDGWVVGGAAGFEQGDYDAADGLSSADGTTGWLAAAVGREFGGGLSLGAGVSGSYGAFDTRRTLLLPGLPRTAEGDTDVATAGGRLRAAWRLDAGPGHLQPTLDLDLAYTHAGGYAERGAGLGNLRVDGSDQLAFVATPSLEVGARTRLGDGVLVGGFATAGVSLSTEDAWETDARLARAPAAAGRFSTQLPIADVLAEVGAGLELEHAASGFEARVEYDGAFGDDYASHGGLLRRSKRF